MGLGVGVGVGLAELFAPGEALALDDGDELAPDDGVVLDPPPPHPANAAKTTIA